MDPVTYQHYFDNLNSYEQKHAPKALFSEGDIQLLLEGKRVSVVGSRKASELGLIRARCITEALVKQNIIVVSGLAEGVDTIAHRTAIELGGKTIAVLGTPLEEAYPKSNKNLLNEIKANHLAISQFASGSRVYQSNFPQRNRTMALISDATIIVEAGENSGTIHQGWEAIRLNRLLFIMENVLENPSLTWPKEMIKYGAQVLHREGLEQVLCEIPNFTSHATLSF